jgi:hypothetical protein
VKSTAAGGGNSMITACESIAGEDTAGANIASADRGDCGFGKAVDISLGGYLVLAGTLSWRLHGRLFR